MRSLSLTVRLGGLQNSEHLEEYGFGGSDSAFEFFVGQSPFFF